MKHSIWWMVGALAIAGCVDASDAGSADPADMPAPDGGLGDGGTTDGQMGDGEAPPPLNGWVEVTLAPRRNLYRIGDDIMAEAAVFDRFGEARDAPVVWSLDPPTIGSVTADGRVNPTGEGQGYVVACTELVCGRAGFFVDDAPPVVAIRSPEKNARLEGFAGRLLMVEGWAVDSRGVAQVQVNGQTVGLDDEGAFNVEVPLEFGINRVLVTANDGVRPPTHAVRYALWAPRWLERDAAGLEVPGIMSLRLDQSLLDADADIEVPDAAGRVEVNELAAFMRLVIGLIDGTRLLDDPQISNTETINLRIDAVRFGEPEIDVAFNAQGLEVFLRLPELSVQTDGQLYIQGEPLSLEGRIGGSIVGYAQTSIALSPEGRLQMGRVDTGVAVESVTGEYAEPAVEALLNALGSQLNSLIRDALEDAIEDLIAEALPEAVQGVLDGVLDSLERLPLTIDSGIEGVAPARLALEMRPARLQLARRSLVGIELDGRIVQENDPLVLLHPDPGVPELSEAEQRYVRGAGLGISARLALINGLLHAVWRAGVLRFRPPLPAQFAGLLGEVEIDTEIPPIVGPAPSDFELPLMVDLVLRLTMQPAGITEPHVFSVRLRAGLGLTIQAGRFGMTLAETPRIEAVLVERGDDRDPPVTADALAGLIESVVWPDVQSALASGLDLNLTPVEVPIDDFAGFAPRLARLSAGPIFTDEPELQNGRITLQGALEVQLDLLEAGE
jgi:hypothetical protein